MDKLLINVRIHTLDGSSSPADALLIRNGRIASLGRQDEFSHLSDVISRQDLGGRIILPGLTDAHIHLQQYAMSFQRLDCETDTLEECLDRIADRAASSAPGEWILGHGWNQNSWDGNFGNANQLDRAAPLNPVYLTAKSLHAAWANSQALSISGVNSTSMDPENGRIVKNELGDPTGILLEKAMKILEDNIPEPSTEAMAELLKHAQSELWKFGLTAVHDFDKRTCFDGLQRLNQTGDLKLRVMKSIPEDDLHHAIGVGLRSGFGDDFLWMGSLKLFADGALGPRTAAMMEPYDGFPQNTGMLNMDREEIFEIGSEAVQNGISLAIHAIGDRANHEVLESFSRLRRFEKENDLHPARHRIEHLQLLHPGDIDRLAKMNLVASMQPVHQPSDRIMAENYWGDRNQYAYALRSQLESGAVLAFGSDAPVESPNPFLGIHAAVTRRAVDGSPGESGWYPNQRLSVAEALQAFTQGPAYASGREDRLGKIKEGFLADLVVLEQDPFEIHPFELKEIKPVSTMVSGEWVFGIQHFD
ncbi:amidohydrolase [Chloroflexota bacterium]